MPYIQQNARKKYLDIFKNISIPQTKGELEFCIFYLMTIFMENKDWRYSNLHDCVYAAMHCADEFRRRHLDEREDVAIKENGDI